MGNFYAKEPATTRPPSPPKFAGVSITKVLPRSSDSDIRVTGNRNYVTPPMWSIEISENELALRPRSHPQMGSTVIVVLTFAVGMVILVRSGLTPYAILWGMVGVVVLIGLFTLFRINGSRGAWLVYDRAARSVALPRDGVNLPADRPVSFEVVSGMTPAPNVAYVSELNLVVLDDAGQPWAYPLIGASMDADGLGEYAKQMAEVIGIPFRIHRT